MGQQRHAWSDNETEEKIQKHKDELKEEFGEKWQKKIWQLGVEAAIERLPSIEERLARVRDKQETLEDKEQKLMARKRKQNIKAKESSLEQEIRELEEEIDEWKSKEIKDREELEEEIWQDYQSSPMSDKKSAMDREEFLSQDRVQRKIDRRLEIQPSEEEKRSKISELESQLEEKRGELEELEVATYAPQ